MGLYFNSGNASFYNAVNSRIYVDKTRLLEYTNSILDTEQRLVCVSRPRRFGKTLTADMLTAYYCKGCNSQSIFADLYISKSEGYLKNLNQYHVIHVDINDFLHRIDSNTMRRVSPMDAIIIMQREILREMQKYYSRDYQNEVYLPKVLAEIYDTFGDKFIIIIDEWDAIFREYKDDKEAQDAYLNLLRGLFKDANSRKFLKLAYITGILPIKKTDTQSSLNDFDEFTMVSPGTLAGYVGFTEEEVHNLCEQYHVDFQQMKRWYNGYCFRKVKNIYNPNSVVKAILNEEFDDYWTRTDTYESLKKYISANVEGLKDIVVDMLTGGRCKVNTKKFQNDFTSLYGKDEVLTLLIHLGYLAYDADKKEVYIPNEEIHSEFEAAVEGTKWNQVIAAMEQSERLLQYTWNGKAEEVASMIDRVHMDNTSILKYNDENALACVIRLAYYSAVNYYTVVRELPTGLGFADIVFIPRQNTDRPCLVVELKYDQTAKGAIDQIHDKEYVTALEEYQGNMLLVGINYDKQTKQHTCVIERWNHDAM